jgi:hypothetical protein
LNILALDPATKTGWALYENGPIESGVQDFSTIRGESNGMHSRSGEDSAKRSKWDRTNTTQILSTSGRCGGFYRVAELVGERTKHYLHRLSKTAGRRRLRSGINIVTIQKWLNHYSLEITQGYLDNVNPSGDDM